MAEEKKGKAKNSWRFIALLFVLVLSGAAIHIWEHPGEARVPRRALKEFPAEIGSWRQAGGDYRFDPETEKILKADDYLSRSYSLPDGRSALFYVGYYATQRNGATYHSPLNCLPGTGWAMSDFERLRINPVGGAPSFEVNRYIVRKGDASYMLVYWYQGRGRTVASEYWGKIYTVMDSVRRRRSDGAMVRVMMPVGKSEGATLDALADFAAQAAPALSAYVPD